MGAYQTLDDIAVDAQRVLVRADLNVPMEQGRITDISRLERLLPTLRELLERHARVIVLSHLGRPKGKRLASLSLRPIAEKLSDLLEQNVVFADDCIGETTEAVVNSLASGEIAVLENLRFHVGEENNDPTFARQLAELGDIYINDAFSVSHRAHASTEQLAHLLPNAAGRYLEAELNALNRVLGTPKRPLAAVVGGAKVSTKIKVLGHLLDKVDTLIIGGGMANTFLHAKGIEVGTSLLEPDLVDTARDILSKAESNECEIVLPLDAVVADTLAENVETATCNIDSVPHRKMILDIGPQTVDDCIARLSASATVVWNGPLGAFEVKPFDAGTNRVAAATADLTEADKLISIAGGGDTIAALNQAGATQRFTYVSSAGGAFLEWLEGRELPGLRALH